MAQKVKIKLTEEQENWLKKHFKHTKNEEIAAKLGISESSMHRLARLYGLKKSPQFMRKCVQEAATAAKQSHLLNGTYPPKGYKIPNREKGGFKPGETSRNRIGAKREAERIKKSAESRRETWRKEKARATFGFPQRTKLHVIPVPKAKIRMRWYLKQRGYILDEKERIAYYTDTTRRAVRIEAKQQPWYKIKPAETVNATGKM